MGKVATQPPEGSCTITDWYQDQSASVGRLMGGTVPPPGDSVAGMALPPRRRGLLAAGRRVLDLGADVTAQDLAAVLRLHQGPFWDGITSRCGCRRIVRTEQEWAEHLQAEWVKARTIETVEQLDALPITTVVEDAFAAVCTKVRDASVFGWIRVSPAIKGVGAANRKPFLPATLIWHPERD